MVVFTYYIVVVRLWLLTLIRKHGAMACLGIVFDRITRYSGSKENFQTESHVLGCPSYYSPMASLHFDN